jgi:hypothetical protein
LPDVSKGRAKLTGTRHKAEIEIAAKGGKADLAGVSQDQAALIRDEVLL